MVCHETEFTIKDQPKNDHDTAATAGGESPAAIHT
jgi:hypothetical protein